MTVGTTSDICCTRILRKFMVDSSKIEKYLNIGPLSDFLLVTKCIFDSWTKEENGRRGRKGEKERTG